MIRKDVSTGIPSDLSASFISGARPAGTVSAVMITQQSHPVEWAMLVTELSEAHEHLGALIDRMVRDAHADPDGDDTTFRIDLGHVFAHLNRAWHTRDHEGDISHERFRHFSRMPDDLEPVG